MPPRGWKLRVTDILEAVSVIRDYVEGMDFEAFQKDRKTVDAVVRNITVIGEAARSVPPKMADAHPEIPWKVMRDIRNVVVHVYFGIDAKVLWDTIQDDLPPLVEPLRKLLEHEA